jgi:hypothetical protein
MSLPRWRPYPLGEQVAAREVVAMAVVVVCLVLPSAEASRLAVTKRPASLKLWLHFFPGRWPGSRMASVSTILTMVRRPIPAFSCAAGETSFLGAGQCCIPWSAGAYHRPGLQQVFFRGHWGTSWFFPILQPALPVGRHWLVRLVNPSRIGGRSSCTFPIMGMFSAGRFCWPLCSSPSLEWIFKDITGSWWTRLIISWLNT